jgi:hypothetical protein
MEHTDNGKEEHPDAMVSQHGAISFILDVDLPSLVVSHGLVS